MSLRSAADQMADILDHIASMSLRKSYPPEEIDAEPAYTLDESEWHAVQHDAKAALDAFNAAMEAERTPVAAE